MSLANLQGKLSRAEMKNIMAGSGTCYLQCDNGFYFTSNACGIITTCPANGHVYSCYCQ